MNICFYGAGSIAKALVRELITNKLMSPGRISVLNRKTQNDSEGDCLAAALFFVIQGTGRFAYVKCYAVKGTSFQGECAARLSELAYHLVIPRLRPETDQITVNS